MNLKDVFDKRCMKWFQTCFSVSISNLWISREVIASMSTDSHWLGRSMRDLSGLMKILCFLIWVWVIWVLTFGENRPTLQFRSVCFTMWIIPQPKEKAKNIVNRDAKAMVYLKFFLTTMNLALCLVLLFQISDQWKQKQFIIKNCRTSSG